MFGNSFTGELQVRRGTLALTGTQTGTSSEPIRIGVPGAEADLPGTFPTVTFNGTGANLTAQIDRDFIVDNGGLNVSGMANRYSVVSAINPLSNATGSQILTGDFTLNSDLRIQGGGGGTAATTGATIFQGAMTEAGKFWIPNGRVVFDTTSVLSNAGGVDMGDFGFTAQVTFQGAATGNANMVLKGGNNAYMRYAGASSLYGGSLVVEGTAAVIPLNTSTIGNAIEIRGATSVLRANVASGTQATWNGVLSGNGTLSLQQVLVGTTTNQVSGTNDGMGTLVLAGSLNTHTGAINVNTGKLQVDGLIAASAQNVVVGTSGALGGSGTINRNVTVNGILAPGNSPGLLTVNGNVTLSSTALFSAELNGNTAGTGYDQLAVNGGVTLGSAALTIVPGFAAAFTDRIFIVVNDAADAISGTFNGLAEGASVSFVFGGDTYTGLITYVADSTTNSLSGGNDIALHSFAIPEPSAGMVLVVLAGLAVARRRRA